MPSVLTPTVDAVTLSFNTFGTGVNIGSVVAQDGSDKAKVDLCPISSRPHGVVVKLVSDGTVEVQSDGVTPEGTFSGLSAGTLYYASTSTAGALATTGTYVVGMAVSDSQIELLVKAREIGPVATAVSITDLTAGNSVGTSFSPGLYGVDRAHLIAKVWTTDPAHTATVGFNYYSDTSTYAQPWQTAQSASITGVHTVSNPYVFEPAVVEPPGTYVPVLHSDAASANTVKASIFWLGLLRAVS